MDNPSVGRGEVALRLIGGLLLTLLAETASAQSSYPLWGDLAPGPYAVGFRSEFIVDSAGSLEGFDALPGRPIRLLIWYPARESAASRALLNAYFDIEPSDVRFATYNTALRARDRDVGRRQFQPASDSLFAEVSGLPTRAHIDAKPEDGRFPLVLHSLGRNDFQQENTVLWEYLASHGYVVVSVPQVGRSLNDLGLAFAVDDLRLQAADVVAALRHMKGQGYVDPQRVALLGHSSGGISALLVAAQEPEVLGIVGLDGSFATAEGVTFLEELAIDVRGKILNLYAKGKPDLDLSWLKARKAIERYDIGLGSGERPNMATHFDFQMWPVYSVVTGVADPRGEYFRSGQLGLAFYYASCRLTRHFLDYINTGNRDSRDFLTGARRLGTLASDHITFGGGE